MALPPPPIGVHTPDWQSGTWHSASAGGGIGYNQTWQNVSATRAWNTTYTNSTSAPILVSINATDRPGASGFNATLYVNNIAIDVFQGTSQAIIPISSSYKVTGNTLFMLLNSWQELR